MALLHESHISIERIPRHEITELTGEYGIHSVIAHVQELIIERLDRPRYGHEDEYPVFLKCAEYLEKSLDAIIDEIP